MRVAGKLPSEIAKELGWANGEDVMHMLKEAYAYDATFLTDQDRRSVLGMELARLDALQAAVWPAAMMGDPKSVDSAVKIVATRARLVGLDQVDPVVSKNLVLVMGDKEEDYIAALKATGVPTSD